MTISFFRTVVGLLIVAIILALVLSTSTLDFHRRSDSTITPAPPAALPPDPLSLRLTNPPPLLALDRSLGDSELDNNQHARGIIRSAGEATLSSQISAQIQLIKYREGESFKRGDLLIKFNCEKYLHAADAAKAALNIHANNLDSSMELDKFNAIGTAELGVAHAQVDKAKAEFDGINNQVQDCEINAPFDGRVTAMMARQFETVPLNHPLVQIADNKMLEADIIVPSSWLSWLQPNTPLTFTIDETNQSLEAEIHRIGAAVDPVSKTVRVVARFKNPPANLLPGMSGFGQFKAKVGNEPR